MSQEEFDVVGKKIASLQEKHGINSTKLMYIKDAYEDFLKEKTQANFDRVKDKIEKLEKDEDDIWNTLLPAMINCACC